MAETANAIVTASLRLIGAIEAGESMSGSEGADGLIALNDMLDEWNNQNLMQTNRIQLTQTLSASDGSYTFGSGGDNSTRPQWIDKAFIRTSSNIDYPIRIIGNDEYSKLSFKTTTSDYPFNLYYRAEYPLGVVELYPVPSTTNTLVLEIPAQFASISTLATSVDLAPGYIKCLKYALAIELAPDYGKEASPTVQRVAAKSMAWIKRVNRQDKKRMANPAGWAVNGRSSGWRGLSG